MTTKIFDPDQVLTPHQFDPDLGDYPKKILAQGDSWFSIGAIPPWATSNILFELNFNETVGIVNCAYPGREMRVMSDPNACGQFTSLMAGKFSWKWDAILISGGGNDMISALNSGLILDSARWDPSSSSVMRYVDPKLLDEFCVNLASYVRQIITLRDSGQNANVPLLFHTYDYAVPRDAPVIPGVGPWLYPVVSAGGKNIPQSDWIPLTDLLIDKVASTIMTTAATNVFVVDTRGKLTPAVAGSDSISNNWENEIHPTPSGYSRLALTWEDLLEHCPARIC